MTNQLSLFNGALRALGERKLASTAEARNAGFILNDIWNDDFVNGVLEQGLWLFATRSVKIDADPDITTSFGYRYAFDIPDDWVRTASLSGDESFNFPLTASVEENGNWYSDITPIYVKYISNDPAFGTNFSLWPRSVIVYAEHVMAMMSCMAITKSQAKFDALAKLTERFLIDARSKDAQNLPPQFAPSGSWVTSRHGKTSRLDRPGSKLIG